MKRKCFFFFILIVFLLGVEPSSSYAGTSSQQPRLFITTSGGTVHALDPTGRLRMKIIVDNGYSGMTQVIPLSPVACVVIVNNGILFLESE